MAVLFLAACQGDNDNTGTDGGETSDPEDDPCSACPPGGYAVDCGYLWGLGEFKDPVCGINKDNAEYLCESTWLGVVLSSPSDKCSGSHEPWDPSANIYADQSSEGLYVVSSALLDRLESSPHDIYLDDMRLDWSEDGDVFVSTEGALSQALGLRFGDVLVDVNGYAFASILDTARLYWTFRNATTLTLTLERDGELVQFVYIIE
jgi:hypothetical protein